MNKLLLLCAAVLFQAACTTAPPQPHGTPFPINTVQEAK